MKIKTSELKGAALDWAVATIEGKKLSRASLAGQKERHGTVVGQGVGLLRFNFSEDWSQAGQIIEREKIDVYHLCPGTWRAEGLGNWYNGQTPLIAAMRCYVASKLGDEVEVPNELA